MSQLSSFVVLPLNNSTAGVTSKLPASLFDEMLERQTSGILAVLVCRIDARIDLINFLSDVSYCILKVA
jgi:hypothetical protein